MFCPLFRNFARISIDRFFFSPLIVSTTPDIWEEAVPILTLIIPIFKDYMKQFFLRYRLDLLFVLSFMLLSWAYFFTPLKEHLVLGGHDTVAGMWQSREQATLLDATGEKSWWSNGIFSGMPNYQISPTYGSSALLGWVGRLITLLSTGPLSFVFLYLFGFYILMRSLKQRPLVSAFGAVAWAFSSYFFIIIAAGHLWKVATLGFIPPTIAGLVLAYRGKYLWGALVTALFTGLQLYSNHPQMTYYFLFVMLFLVIAYGVEAARKHTWAQWLKASGAVIVGGLMGLMMNLPNMYHTWQYAKESMRGKSELTFNPAKMSKQSAAAAAQTGASGADNAEGTERATNGLDRDYITQWSYGIDETLTLMIANFKGGGSASIQQLDNADQLNGYEETLQHAGQLQQAMGENAGSLPGINQYWGNQPFTVGPVYVGAIICFLFLLSLGFVRGPMKWGLLTATFLSLLFAWGKNLMPVTDFFIDHLPMYAKFRTVSSALVVAEFTIPLLAILALSEVIRRPEDLLKTRRGQYSLLFAGVFSAGLCLLFAVAPSLSNLLADSDKEIFTQLQSVGVPADFVSSYRAAVTTLHGSILSADAWRSFFLIAIAITLIAIYARYPKKLPAPLMVGALLVLTLGDMWTVNKRYLNTDSFSEPQVMEEGLKKTPADETILQDKSLDYRVLNLGNGGSPFNETSNQTAYWHKSVGGYHAAKLHRYQDLIDAYLNAECVALNKAIQQHYNALLADSNHLAARGITSQADLVKAVSQELRTDSVSPVLNMLNTKWVILAGGQFAVENPGTNGNAWFVDRLDFVPNADAELKALAKTDLKHAAVADERFKTDLATSTLGNGTVKLTHYQPNELRYTVQSDKGGVVALSEIYYPGWTATLDGQEIPVARVNYVLRAVKVPAGQHTLVLTFRPSSVSSTEIIAYLTLALLALGFAFALWQSFRSQKGKAEETA